MLKNICIYPNYRVLGEVKESTFTQGDKQSKRVSFAISSYHPDSNGVFLKLYCHAFDQVAEEIIKANLKKDDIITVSCEHGLFKTKQGVMESRYKVNGFSYVKNSSKKEKTEEETEETGNNSNIGEFMGFLNSMLG